MDAPDSLADTTDTQTNKRTDRRTDEETRLFAHPSVRPSVRSSICLLAGVRHYVKSISTSNSTWTVIFNLWISCTYGVFWYLSAPFLVTCLLQHFSFPDRVSHFCN